jgi:hypothetical protein
MRVLPRHDDALGTHPGSCDALPRGAWKPWVNGPGFVRTAAVRCPVCSALFCLADHRIGAEGTVSPSIVCPYGCGFHEFVRLAGWEPHTG